MSRSVISWIVMCQVETSQCQACRSDPVLLVPSNGISHDSCMPPVIAALWGTDLACSMDSASHLASEAQANKWKLFCFFPVPSFLHCMNAICLLKCSVPISGHPTHFQWNTHVRVRGNTPHTHTHTRVHAKSLCAFPTHVKKENWNLSLPNYSVLLPKEMFLFSFIYLYLFFTWKREWWWWKTSCFSFHEQSCGNWHIKDRDSSEANELQLCVCVCVKGVWLVAFLLKKKKLIKLSCYVMQCLFLIICLQASKEHLGFITTSQYLH